MQIWKPLARFFITRVGGGRNDAIPNRVSLAESRHDLAKEMNLAHADAIHYWRVAVIAGMVVLIAAALIALLSLRAWRRRE